MTTWEFKDLMHVPVVSNASAREIGRVHEVLFDPSANALFGLVVSPAVKNDPLVLVPFADIRTIGKDAITVEGLNAGAFEENVQAKTISAAGGYHNGMNVMTESGESVGKVDKITLHDDGTVASYHSTTGFFFGTKHDIEPSEVVSGSEEKLIISDSAREGAARTVTAQGRTTDRATAQTPASRSSEPVAASTDSRPNGGSLAGVEPALEASASPMGEGSNQPSSPSPARSGTPDNSMFTAKEIPSLEPTQSSPREAASGQVSKGPAPDLAPTSPGR